MFQQKQGPPGNEIPFATETLPATERHTSEPCCMCAHKPLHQLLYDRDNEKYMT